MPASQQHITASTPMGANLAAGGATFRVWAPGASAVHVCRGGAGAYVPAPADALVKNQATGHFTGFFAGVTDGTPYRFWVVGPGGQGFKRDPWARELELGGYPDCDCIVRDPDTYPWHDASYRSPAFSDLVVYQLHIGVFYAVDDAGNDIRHRRVSKFLDVLDRVEYLADLGVNAIQPLPLVEFQGEWSLGYNGSDLFSPEMDYCVGPDELPRYLPRVNRLLARKGCAPLTAAQLGGQVNQLKALVDVCHLYGLAVIPDVVYNHAGGNFGSQGLDHFDMPSSPDRHNSIYFSEHDLAGGRVFDYGRPDVRDFLIQNALMYLREYHADGLRFDEVSAMDRNGGWSLCQDLTETLEHVKPCAALIAEYWGEHRWLGVWEPPDGMGFDLAYNDSLRDRVRDVVARAAGGADAELQLGSLGPALERPWNFSSAWQAFNCVENHDFVLDMDGDHCKPRIPRLAGGDDSRSWYARSRSRVATGLLLTAPGVPLIFMGQEILEDKWWSDNPNRDDRLVWWAGLNGADRHMSDHHRFVRELIWLRRRHPALRAEPVSVYHVDELNRVLAFHRWVPGVGRDVVVVVSLREQTFADRSYAIGLPQPGYWHEVLNSDVFDNFSNPWVQGNAGGVNADGPGMHGMPASAGITIPAGAILVFSRDPGD